MKDSALKLWNKLSYASKIVFVLWTLCVIFYFFDESNTNTIAQEISVALVGYIMFVWLAQIISRRRKKKNKKSENAKTDSVDKYNSKYYSAKIKNENSFSDLLRLQKDQELEKIKNKNTAFHNMVLNNPNILQIIEKDIFDFYSELGIHILVSKTDIHANQIVVRIVPHDGVRVKTVLSFEDDLALRLGVPIEMEVFSKFGFIGIMIPIDYINTIININ